ncbi:hypothetical protein OTK49_03035 [Vibrio coralliirubri]|uniref:hypothetical protein n=1 Tax=Vibrio coralliirubri TaxID=1516159 RepID=UPI00228534CC|nr:hypothetical protein [Vibrio coralliirubri]MCY9861490.1 hypothetical protein [Vibrio coralliirubri]
MSEKKLTVHGSNHKGLSTLIRSSFSGFGSNGAQHGVGVYVYPLDRVESSMFYAGEDGSIYLAEIDTSEYIRIEEEEYLTSHLREMLFNAVNAVDDVPVKIRLATDFAGREQRLFDSEADADAFYDSMMEEAEGWRLPDRYHPDYESDQDGYVVVSYGRRELDDMDDIHVSTHEIHHSLNAISSVFSTEVWSQLADGLIVNDLGGGEFYLSFSPLEVIKEFSSRLGADAIMMASAALDPSKNQILDYDLSSRNSILYIGKDGKLSNDMSDVYPVEGELYIEPRPNPKIHFEKVSGEHQVMPIVISTLARSYPEWGHAELRFDNNPRITLAEMNSKLVEQAGGVTSFKLYHGTSSEFLPSIASEGLKCRNSSGVKAHYYNGSTEESLSDRSYFASEFGLGAANAAARSAAAAYGGFPVILEFDVEPKLLSKLAPDEDSKKLSFEESLSTIGTCAFIGNLNPEHLSVAPARINHQLDCLKLEYANQALEDSRVVCAPELNNKADAFRVGNSRKLRI